MLLCNALLGKGAGWPIMLCSLFALVPISTLFNVHAEWTKAIEICSLRSFSLLSFPVYTYTPAFVLLNSFSLTAHQNSDSSRGKNKCSYVIATPTLSSFTQRYRESASRVSLYTRPHQLDFMFLGFCGSCFSRIEECN